MSRTIESEALVIGTGIAGCVAALSLADNGVQTTIVTRSDDPGNANTKYAQGGIVYTGPDDSPSLLAQDITQAGADWSNPEAVERLAKSGPNLVREWLIERAGVEFDRDEHGDLALALEGGHSCARVVHVADRTGVAIESALVEQLRAHPEIRILSSHTAVDFISSADHTDNPHLRYRPLTCLGAFLLNRKSGEVDMCVSANTIIASGGLGSIYQWSTNPPGARGDGIAMAYRAGARLTNLEFVQFHPTALYLPDAPRFLISESVRGEGARLVHADGTAFMEEYDPEWKDLAPRDVICRAIYKELRKRNVENVYLDLASTIPAERIRSRFPTIFETCSRYGIDPTSQPIPVVPAAHYACGGVWVDGSGRTTVDNLYAAGEVSCTGVHGANRLASTSLLEGLVWGHIAARDIVEKEASGADLDADAIRPWKHSGSTAPHDAIVQKHAATLRSIMWEDVGVIRTTSGLHRALDAIAELERIIRHDFDMCRPTDALVGLRNMTTVGRLTTQSALSNERSAGCHYRTTTEPVV